MSCCCGRCISMWRASFVPCLRFEYVLLLVFNKHGVGLEQQTLFHVSLEHVSCEGLSMSCGYSLFQATRKIATHPIIATPQEQEESIHFQAQPTHLSFIASLFQATRRQNGNTSYYCHSSRERRKHTFSSPAHTP